ncbi:MAG: glycosyltransferase family 4 protein [Bryobacteraceae bacterium]
MKILWVNPNFLHPTTKGGQIRTLEILRHLHRWHEVHYAALSSPDATEGPSRAGEYSARSYAFPHRVPGKRSAAFLGQLSRGLLSPVPVAVSRFYSPALARFVVESLESGSFDRVVCDFLAAAPHFPDLGRALLFQHNVETIIWRRHAEHASNPMAKAYLRMQAKRMFQYERRACRAAGDIVAVSGVDANKMREMFGVTRVHEIPTGVDLEYFRPTAPHPPVADLLFVGSMDWLPNVDGVKHFLAEILPRIRKKRPQTTFAIVGRDPSPELKAIAARTPGVIVTGTVPDVRRYVWGARVSVVPLRIGGGTRLKIYESMAARVPVVSTRVGAEGLEVTHPENIRLADGPDEFAAACLELLASEGDRIRQAESAWQLVSSRFSSEKVARRFEEILRGAPPAGRAS